MAIVYNNDSVKTNERILTSFFGYNNPVYLDAFNSGSAFIFMTKPSLYLAPIKPSITNTIDQLAYLNMCKDPKFTQFLINECKTENDKMLIKQLSYQTFGDVPSYFLPIFTNLVRNSDLIDITLGNYTAFATRNGFSYILPSFTTQSETAGNFSLTVTETSNMDFTKMMTIWVNYINNIVRGIFSANQIMINNNIIDYASSLYIFILAPDGKTIKSYARYTGVYPTAIPLSSASANRGSTGALDLNLSFQYTLYEANNPKILEDFNALSLKLISNSHNTTNESYTDSEYLNYTYAGNGVDYEPISQSAILNKDYLLSSTERSIVTSDDRDPLVFITETSNGYEYELSFGANTFTNYETETSFGDPTNLKKLYAN